MRPYYEDGSVTIYHGDALDVLDATNLGDMGAVITDPPYASGGRQSANTRADYATSIHRPQGSRPARRRDRDRRALLRDRSPADGAGRGQG